MKDSNDKASLELFWDDWKAEWQYRFTKKSGQIVYEGDRKWAERQAGHYGLALPEPEVEVIDEKE